MSKKVNGLSRREADKIALEHAIEQLIKSPSAKILEKEFKLEARGDKLAVEIGQNFASFLRENKEELKLDLARKALAGLIDKSFGTFVDKAAIRKNIMYNAARVAYGGVKDGKKVAGMGWQAVEDILNQNLPVRELKPAMQKAVPEKLQQKRTKPDPDPDLGEGDAKKAKPEMDDVLSIDPEQLTHQQALSAALQLLRQCNIVLKVEDHELIAAIDKVQDLLKSKIAAVATQKAA